MFHPWTTLILCSLEGRKFTLKYMQQLFGSVFYTLADSKSQVWKDLHKFLTHSVNNSVCVCKEPFFGENNFKFKFAIVKQLYGAFMLLSTVFECWCVLPQRLSVSFWCPSLQQCGWVFLVRNTYLASNKYSVKLQYCACLHHMICYQIIQDGLYI